MKKTLIIGTLLFIAATTVYWKSIPHSFNTVYENRRFFDSDGEFIVRQYRLGKTFTHNDHLLYHILGKAIQQHSGPIPSLNGDIVRSHKVLSVVSGGLGVLLFYLMGLALTSRQLPSVLGALLIGGCAGWRFVEATIDTYLPCLLASAAALGAALLVIKQPSLKASAALGALAGLAFLFRTDSILLVVLGLSLVRQREGMWARTGTAAVTGLVVGVLGYFVLAHACYDVAWSDVPQWARGALQRPEAAHERSWGLMDNLSAPNVAKTLANHLCYATVFPQLTTTRSANLVEAYSPSGLALLVGYIATLLTASGYVLLRLIRRNTTATAELRLLAVIALLWIVGRVVFYSWWDPKDPFLFANMTLPAIWLLLMLGVQQAYQTHENSRLTVWIIPIALFMLTSLIWIHSCRLLILPLRQFI